MARIVEDSQHDPGHLGLGGEEGAPFPTDMHECTMAPEGCKTHPRIMYYSSMTTQTKVCTKCSLPKDLDKFPRNKNSKDGRASACLACKAIYRDEHREEQRQWAKNYHAAHPELATNRNLMLLYKITLDDIEKLIQEQGGVCPVCRLPVQATNPGKKRVRAVDHNKTCCPGRTSCGKCVRGILHMTCNVNLGVMEKWASLGRVTLSEELLRYTQRGLP